MNLIYQNYGWNVQSVFALLKPKPKALITENSSLIKHGMLGFFSPSSMKRKMRYFFLFDRAIIVTAPMKKKFRLKIYIHLRPGVELVDDPDDTQFRLNVVYKGKGVPMIMYADSIKDKNAWIRDIDTVLWKIRDGDYSLEAGSNVATPGQTPVSNLSLSETDISKAGNVDPRINRKPAYVQSKEDDQMRQKRNRSNTTGTIGARKAGPMTLDLKKGGASNLDRQKSFHATNDSAMHYISDEESDSEDDEEEKARLQRKREKRNRNAGTSKSPRDHHNLVSPRSRGNSGQNPVSPRGDRSDRGDNPISPRGERSSSKTPRGDRDGGALVSPRGDRSASQQIPVSPRDRQISHSAQNYVSPPTSLGRQQQTSNSMTDLTRGMDFVSLNPPSPLHSPRGDRQSQQIPMGSFPAQTYQQQPYGSQGMPALPNRQIGQPQSPSTSFGVLPQQPQSPTQQHIPTNALSPPTSTGHPQQQSPQQQPMLYAVPASQPGPGGTTQQGTYYMDPTAYAHYVQQLQMQQMQLMQQQQMLQQQQLLHSQQSGAASSPLGGSASSLPMMSPGMPLQFNTPMPGPPSPAVPERT